MRASIFGDGDAWCTAILLVEGSRKECSDVYRTVTFYEFIIIKIENHLAYLIAVDRFVQVGVVTWFDGLDSVENCGKNDFGNQGPGHHQQVAPHILVTNK